MRVLHVVKNSDGAGWAARQVRELVKLGVDIHVALPSLEGDAIPLWRESGAELHCSDLRFPARTPWRIPDALSRVREIVHEIRPELIHAHFVTCILAVRAALGPNHSIPRIFQVPGPLHLEHALYKRGEIGLAGPRDYWIGASEYIRSLYIAAGLPPDRVFVSYYGFEPRLFRTHRTGILRQKLRIPADARVVGNVNLI